MEVYNIVVTQWGGMEQRVSNVLGAVLICVGLNLKKWIRCMQHARCRRFVSISNPNFCALFEHLSKHSR